MIDPHDVAILTVHGNGPDYTGDFAERYSWPRLQIEMLRRCTSPGYTVIAYGNAIIDSHAEFLRSCPEVELYTDADTGFSVLEHVWPARNWLVEQSASRFKYLVTLDSDAFPVRAGWIDRYPGALSDEQPLVAVQRLENGDTHSDRSFMVFTSDAWRVYGFDFSMVGIVDGGAKISLSVETAGKRWWKLNRTNVWDPPPVISAIYDGHMYHHAAGTRLPHFRQNRRDWNDRSAFEEHVRVHSLLSARIHDDTDGLVSDLLGGVSRTDRIAPGCF